MGRFGNRLAGAFLALAAIFGMTGPVLAHEVTPMRVELVPQSGSRSALISIRNTRENDVPFEIVTQLRTTARDGSETLTPADGDFVIFPPQGLVKPGTTQALRIEYVGEQRLSESRSYLVDVREVPVTPPGFSGIKTVYNFGVAVYVKPPGAFTDLEVSPATREGDTIAFEIRNRGNDHAVLTRRDVELRFASGTVRMNGSEFASRTDNPVVPPNAVRSFELNAQGLPEGAPIAIRVLDPS
jgi:P pilus assembly chaperone PapD